MLKSNVSMQGSYSNIVTRGNHHAVTFYTHDNANEKRSVFLIIGARISKESKSKCTLKCTFFMYSIAPLTLSVITPITQR